jgi:hypothetical protein
VYSGVVEAEVLLPKSSDSSDDSVQATATLLRPSHWTQRSSSSSSSGSFSVTESDDDATDVTTAVHADTDSSSGASSSGSSGSSGSTAGGWGAAVDDVEPLEPMELPPSAAAADAEMWDDDDLQVISEIVSNEY